MARCSCGNATCSCVIKPDPGSGVTVTGSGSPTRPYLIGLESEGDIRNQIGVSDTPTLNLEMGAPVDGKSTIFGYATQKLTDLADVADLEGPQEGDVPIWTNGHWEFKPQGTVNPGAISAINGIGGDGSNADPLKALTSGIWGQSPLDLYGTNLASAAPPIYVDEAGNLRAQPLSYEVAAKGVTDPPNTYPLGPSVMTLSTAVASAGGWPQGVSGIVVTFRRRVGDATYAAAQHWYRNPAAGTMPMMMTRAGNQNYAAGAPGWTPWVTTVEDTGWTDIAIQSGFTAQGTEKPQVRRLNGVVYSRGGWSSTGMTISATNDPIGTIPAGFRPTQNVLWRAGSAAGNVTTQMFIAATGNVSVRNGPVVNYAMMGVSWLTD
jgi:hypothetical protein